MRIYSIPVLSLDGAEMPSCVARAERRDEAEGVAATAIRKVGNNVIVVADGYVVIKEKISDEYQHEFNRDDQARRPGRRQGRKHGARKVR